MRQNQSISLILLLLLTSTMSAVWAHDKTSQKGVSASVIIHASQDNVWTAICDTKSFEENIKSVKGNEAIVEQKLGSLPIFGSTHVLVRTRVFPQSRIEYDLLESNHLKELNGAWILTPINKERTKLELTSYCDPGLPVPRFLVNAYTQGRCKNRLRRVKALAETVHKQTRKTETASNTK